MENFSEMGKTSKPLTILVAQQWLTHEKVQALSDQGHQIQVAPEADLILSPAGWAWSDIMWPFLTLALKGARRRRQEEPA